MKTEIRVEGMTCEGCAKTVREKIEAIDGVQAVEINRSTNKAIIESSKPIDQDQFVAALADTNYSVVK